VKRFLVVALAILVIGIGAAGIGGWWAERHWTEPGARAGAVTVAIPRGAGLERITRILDDAGLFSHPFDRLLFPTVVKATGRAADLKAGEYAVPAAASLEAIADMLATGKGIVQYPVTVPEGLTSAEVLDLVAGVETLSGPLPAVPDEGRLLPETYATIRDEERATLVARMATALDTALAEAWAERAGDLPFDTPEEALVLASIIEKETAVPEERARVAAVFVNRLRRGMPLQSDPTVIYGLAPETGDLGRPLRRSDLKTDHAWNTYVHPGLPPTPIANAGRAAIEAAVNPAQTEELFFVADGTGGHAFAETLREHNRNVAAWRRFLREQGRR